jgi:cell division septation protein DedD
MTQSENGEHELVLGNKQLLSAFFVVVVLLGVFFTMGYFVGKNTATGGYNNGQSASSSGGLRPDPAGKPVESASSGGTLTPPAAPESTTSPADTNPQPAIDAKPAPSTQPAAEEPKRETVKSERLPDPVVPPTKEQKYLQVAAIHRSDAENMVKVLKDHGFPARLGESPKQGLVRVLVGPFNTTSELGHTKSDLKAKGFDSIVASSN